MNKKREEKPHYTTRKISIGTGYGLGVNSEAKLFFGNRIEREWLTVKEAAWLLRLTPNALRIKVHRNQVPVYRLGRRLRFRRSECMALFKKEETKHVD